jgi:hypothetical protein
MIGPTVGSYLAVEIAQLLLSTATALVAAWLTVRGSLALVVDEAPVSSASSAQAVP